MYLPVLIFRLSYPFRGKPLVSGSEKFCDTLKFHLPLRGIEVEIFIEATNVERWGGKGEVQRISFYPRCVDIWAC